jgi:methionine-rich copper-binding protein CopC
MTHSPSARPIRNRRAGTAALLTALLVVVLGAGAAPAAWAHTDLASSDPADGSTVEQAPTVLRLVFADPVAAPDPASSALTIAVAGAAPVEIPATVDGDTVSADLTGVTLPAAATSPAEWEIGYRLVATDGDTFTGDLTFTVAAASSAPGSSAGIETSAPAEPTTTGTSPTGASPTSAATTTVTSATTENSAAAPGTTDVTTTADTTAPTSTTTSTSPSAAATASDGGGSGWWWFAGLALVVLLAGGGYWYARSRRADPQG